MRRLTLALVLVPGLALVGACGSYRYVSRAPSGGTIALQGDRDSAMDKARKAMQEHCQGPYTIAWEGEVVVGEDTYAGAESGRTRRGTTATRAASSTRAATEWRVEYVCGSEPYYDEGGGSYTPDGLGGGPTGGPPPPGQRPGEY